MKRPLAWLVAALDARHGRLLAIPFLLLAALLCWHLESTPLAGIRNLYFDSAQRLMPRDRSEIPAVLVAIDEPSLRAHGQWPWRRDRLAALVAKILAGQPLAVGLDMLFIESDRFSPANLARDLPEISGETASRLVDPDRRLAVALAAGPTVIALSGADGALPTARQPARSTPLVSEDADPARALPAFPAALVALPALEAAAQGQGLINAPPDAPGYRAEQGVLRRVPLLARIGDGVVPSLGLEMVRVALGAPAVRFDGGALAHAGAGNYRVPTLADGQLALHFGYYRGDRTLSAADVLSGKVGPDTWRGRFVVIALTGQGLIDRVTTPLGELSYGADIHLQVIESLLAGEGLRRPTWMKGVELALLLLAGLGLMAGVPRLRPVWAASAGGLVFAALLGSGYAAFATGRWLLDGASLVILLNPLFIVLLGHTLVEADRRRRRAERALQASREAAARSEGELDAARRIQMGMLPDLKREFSGDPRFAVAACLEPARAVGGDFYDCFRLDENRLCFLIGDVSGKGVPASLFMTVAKVLTGALTRRADDLGGALQAVQGELSANNPEMMFVTLFAAVLDLESGHLECVCAGHDAPLLMRQGQLTTIDVRAISGPPLCALSSYAFASVGVDLAPGDLLCLFTDGVTEATDGKCFYGKERLSASFANLAGSGPEHVVTGLRNDVRQFEAGHAPADDLTLLALRWNGPNEP